MSPTWDEYLADARAHLDAARAAAELGAAPPRVPVRPEDVMPEKLRGDVERLRMGYDQLASEVALRMDAIEQALATSVRRSPHAEQAPARFIDTSV